MRKVMIVGAGQSGMQLALGLQSAGHLVTVVTDRPGDEIHDGPVLSSQCMFDSSLAIEREMGLDFWSKLCPPIEGVALTAPYPADPGSKMIDWSHRLDRPAQSVDQRVKLARWMDEFTRRGGDLRVQTATVDDLERWTLAHELVIVAAGKGSIARLFGVDSARSPHSRAQRALALTYVNGMRPRDGHTAVNFNLLPGVGEYFVFPALTTSGPCDIMVFEGIPGGPMDCWSQVRTPAEHLRQSLHILETFVPWEVQRCAHLRLTDPLGTLVGQVVPTVRHPCARLPSGRLVFGMGDVVVLNDPITGQGANGAAKCARVYEQAIVAHEDRPFDAGFMQRTFDRYWQYAKHVVDWTNAMLAPPQPHMLRLLGTAGEMPGVARRFANGFDDPRDYANFFMTPEKADTFLRQASCLT